jgi:hypothetical protein
MWEAIRYSTFIKNNALLVLLVCGRLEILGHYELISS